MIAAFDVACRERASRRNGFGVDSLAAAERLGRHHRGADRLDLRLLLLAAILAGEGVLGRRVGRAVAGLVTALALLATTAVLNQENSEHPLSIHMGINSGVALVGSTRFEGLRGTRWTFTASGPVTFFAW